MGYNLVIGELENSYDEESRTWFQYAKGLVSETAPIFENDEFTLNTSERSPSYSGWASFCRSTGLDSLFYKEGGFLFNHPGCVPIKNEHLQIVKNARLNYEQNHKNLTPTFCDIGDVNFKIENAHYARLLWLEFWLDYALKNCKFPVFSNS